MRVRSGRHVTTLLFLLLTRNVSVAQIGGVNTYYSSANISDLTAGPDGALWFINCLETSCASFAIGRMTLVGGFVEYPTPGMTPAAITPGPDGQMWFTDPLTNNIGRICASVSSGNCPSVGYITTYHIATPDSDPGGIRAGGDGALWFLERAASQIGRVCVSTTAANCPSVGHIVEYPIPTPGNIRRITTGPDGAMWFTETTDNQIGQIVRICATPTSQGCSVVGEIAEYPVEPPGEPVDITTGPDGALWFTDAGLEEIGRITVTGQITEYAANRGYDELGYITPGADGTLWFSSMWDGTYCYLGQMTMSGEFPTFSPLCGYPTALTSGPDGSIWIGDWYDGGVIEQVLPAARRNGIDMCATCNAPTASELIQLQEAGVRYAVVEGSQHGSSVPAKLLTKFSNAGIKTAAYCFLYFSQDAPTGDQQVKACIDSIANELSSVSFVALDVENQQGSLIADTLSVIQAAVKQLLSTSGVKKIAIYTKSIDWQKFAANTTRYSFYPLWMAAHDRFMSYTDPAGNLKCAGSNAPAALVPTYHGGLGLPNLMPPAAITAFSISGNVVTFVANNQFLAGQRAAISGLTTGTFLNGHKVTVLASDLQTTKFAADFTHPDVDYTPDSGSATLVLFGGWTAQSGAQFDIGAAGSNGACLFGGTYDFDVFDPSLFGPDIAISVSTSPNALIIPRGTEASTTLAITPVEGFTGVVTLHCTEEPASSACTISPSTVTLDGTNPAGTTISVKVSSKAATGAYALQVNGSGSGVNRNAFVGLTVQ